MTGLDLINKFNKDLWNHSDDMFGSSFRDDKEKEYIEKGLAARKFFKQFSLHEDVVVNEAEMQDGVLTVKFGVKEPKDIEGVDINIK